MSNGDVNAVEFGRLIASNEALIAAVEKLTERMERQEAHMVEVQKDKAKGQGVLATIGSLGAVVGFLLKIGWDYLTAGHKP